ncbi:MAG: antibiotic biosynthesis monooxygenase [bacterium]
MADESFRLIVRQSIKPGRLEEFKKLATEYTAAAEANEPTTRGYEWFVAEDGSACYLNEFYGSSEAFLLHFGNLGPKLGAMLEISPMEEMIVLGEPSQHVRDMLTGHGAKFYAPHVGFAR